MIVPQIASMVFVMNLALIVCVKWDGKELTAHKWTVVMEDLDQMKRVFAIVPMDLVVSIVKCVLVNLPAT